MTLVAHLGNDIVMSGRLAQGPELPDIMGQRFLDIHMFSHLHGSHRNREMCMVGG